MPTFSICDTSTLEKVSKPPFKSAVRDASLNDRMTTKAQALKTPARICGNSTCRKACQAVAPQARAASVCCSR